MTKLFIFFAVSCALSYSLAEDIRVDFLETREAVNADFCRTDDPNSYGDCGLGYKDRMVNIYVPDSVAKIILKQIDEARDKNFYDKIDNKDFFHGHLFLKGPRTQYASPRDYFNDITADLFHSAEYNNRWLKEAKTGIPVNERRPRSFVGWLDGTVQNAFELFPEGYPLTRNYESAGTIYPNEVQAIRPDLSSHTIHSNSYPGIFVTACKGEDCRTCEIDNQLLIVNEPTGRYLTKKGEKVDFYLRCFYPRN